MIKIQKLVNQHKHKHYQICNTFAKYIRPKFSFTTSKDKLTNTEPNNLKELDINSESKSEKSESLKNFMIFPIKHVLFPYSSYSTRISSTQHELLTRLKIQYVAAFLTKEALQKEHHTQELDNDQHEVEPTISQQPKAKESGMAEAHSKAKSDVKIANIDEEKKVERAKILPLNIQNPRSKRSRNALAGNIVTPDDNDTHHIIIYDDNK